MQVKAMYKINLYTEKIKPNHPITPHPKSHETYADSAGPGIVYSTGAV